MWRDFNKKSKKAKFVASNNRLRIAGVIIFLLFLSLIARLFSLQIIKHDLYNNLALSQHQIYNQLKAPRGRIFLRENFAGEDNLFLAATNRDFAFIYVIPKDIVNPLDLANKFYKFFDEKKVVNQVEEELKADHRQILNNRLLIINESEDLNLEEKKIEKDKIIKNYEESLLKDDSLQLREININREIDKRKEIIINNYLKILDKPGDPYEPLIDKIDDKKLLSLYAFLLSDEENTYSENDLERKLERIYYKDSGKLVKIPGLAFNINNFRFYPEPSLASHLLGFVGVNGDNLTGRYGLEEFFEYELSGSPGYLQTEKGSGSTIIVNDREYVKAKKGSDLVLTINRSIQHFVCKKLEESIEYHQAEGGTVIIVHPNTGAIIAMCSVPGFDPNDYRNVSDISIFKNPAVSDQFEPGSTFKTITMAAAIEEGKVGPNTTYKDEGQIMISGWPRPLSNSDFSSNGAYGVVDMKKVLEKSLNTGAIFAMRQVGSKTFVEYLKKFGFGEKTGIELGSESPGNIRNLLGDRIREIDAATASFGQGIAVTPLQMVMSYQALANNGKLMKPYIVSEIINSDNEIQEIKAKEVSQVVSAKTANTVLAMLVSVVENGHATKAIIPGYYIGGKTGTAQIPEAGSYSSDKFIHIFTGIAPIDKPRFVMLVKIDKPQGAKFAEATAVPLWRDIAEFLLNYYNIPKNF
jgi:cell division protein FtsI/penicillin-binding protein 2